MKKKQNRRDFMKTSAKIAGTGLIVSQGLSAEAGAYVAAPGEIKIAVVGCGGRGTGAANQALEADESIRLVAMADAFPDRLENSLKGLSAKYAETEKIQVRDDAKFVGFDAYKKAIDMADVVILATPPGFRPLHFEYAVQQGKHVFMEKPCATDVAGVKRVLAAAKEAVNKKLNVVVGLQRHYQGSYRAVKEIVDKGKLGDIVSGQVYWNSAGVWVRPRKYQQTELEYQMRNWYYFNWLCGDHILEQHIHNIDVANWFIGSYPVKAQGMGGREVRNGKDHGHIFDHHFVEFTYADGQVISSQCRHQKGCFNRVEEVFQTTKGSIRTNGGNFGEVMLKGKQQYLHEGEEDVNPYQQEHNELFAAIKAGEYKFADAENGAKSTMTAILGRMVTYSGQEITWDQAMEVDMNLVPDGLSSFDDAAPILPDEYGNYPVPTPGETKFI
ncbi:MAG: Gfo/Idh/MocA family oxidoreductase [Cyclobacteriaceae bacterium]